MRVAAKGKTSHGNPSATPRPMPVVDVDIEVGRSLPQIVVADSFGERSPADKLGKRAKAPPRAPSAGRTGKRATVTRSPARKTTAGRGALISGAVGDAIRVIGRAFLLPAK
jgi:hypothetical protein